MMDYALYLRAVLSLVVVLFMIGLLAYTIRRYGTALRMRGGRGQKRLGIIEIASVDPRRRLILIRRDDVEHLVLTGGANDIVIESGIRTARAAPLPVADDQTEVGSPAAGSFRRQLDQVRF